MCSHLHCHYCLFVLASIRIDITEVGLGQRQASFVGDERDMGLILGSDGEDNGEEKVGPGSNVSWHQNSYTTCLP